jgi:hypothetical protein
MMQLAIGLGAAVVIIPVAVIAMYQKRRSAHDRRMGVRRKSKIEL